MKTIPSTLICGVVLAFLTSTGQAQSFSIPRFTTNGGGGPSSGGSFSLNGTLGQPEAGTMSGGNYSLAGGLLGASQTPPLVPTVIKLWVVGLDVHLRFIGIPGRIYYVERAHSVTGPWPDRLAAITMPIEGVVEFVDTTGLISPQSFYRTSTD